MRLTPLVCRVPSIGMEHRPLDASRWTGLFRLAHPAPPVATAVEGSAGAWPAAGVTWEAAASPASALPPGRLNELSAGLSPPSESQVVGRGSVRGGSAVSRGRQLLRKASQFCGVSTGSSQGLGGRCPFCCVVETKAGRSRGCSSQGPFLRLPWRDAQQLLQASWGPGPGQVLGGSGERRQLHLWVLLVTAGGQTLLSLRWHSPVGGRFVYFVYVPRTCFYSDHASGQHTWLEQVDAFASGVAPARLS